MSKDNTLDEQIDIRRYANRIRDAYTLTEAEDILKQLIESVCMEVTHMPEGWIYVPDVYDHESLQEAYEHGFMDCMSAMKSKQTKTLQTILGIRSGK